MAITRRPYRRRLRPGGGRAIERAADVDEARIWVFAVSRAREPMEHGFLAGRRDCEDRSALGFAAPFKGRAIERTVNVEEARIRVFAVSRHAEGMEHSCLAGRRDREDGSIVVCAPTIRRAVERIVDVDEARIRVFAVSKISVLHPVGRPDSKDCVDS